VSEDAADPAPSRGEGARRADRPQERGCPLHSDIPGAGPVGLRSLLHGPRVPGEVPGAARPPRVWRMRSHRAARELLRRREGTTQAGFTAEAIPRGWLRRHPILLSDGPGHDAQRRAVGRFFSPQHVGRSSSATMEREAARLVDEAVRADGCDLGQLALLYSVAVSREIVGLTASSLEGMSRRLVRLQRQPGVDLTRPRWGRSLPRWALAALRGLGPLAAFHLRDVRAAIRRRRRQPADDVISHLLAQGARAADVLVECITYASAGMITTREFLVMACWHLLDDDALRERFLAGDREEKAAILREIIRLEPVVGHLYRRAREPFAPSECPAADDEILPGDLLDIHVRGRQRRRAGHGGGPARVPAAPAAAARGLGGWAQLRRRSAPLPRRAPRDHRVGGAAGAPPHGRAPPRAGPGHRLGRRRRGIPPAWHAAGVPRTRRLNPARVRGPDAAPSAVHLEGLTACVHTATPTSRALGSQCYSRSRMNHILRGQ
jgi:cytochrome P450